MIKDYVETTHAAGVAVSFFDNGRSCVIAAGERDGKGQGPVTADTLFAMGSIQKTFSSLALATDIVQGKARIEDPASRYLVGDDGSHVSPASAFNQITLRNLVTHTASLPNGQPGLGERDGWSLYRDRQLPAATIHYLDTWSPPYPPGTRYSYSNMGHALVGYVDIAIAHEPYAPMMSSAVTTPLGMAHTSRSICDGPNPLCSAGHGPRGRRLNGEVAGLWTTADDMLRYIEAQLGALRVPELQAKAIALTHQELFRENPRHGVAMAWEIWNSGPDLMLSKNGEDSGFTSWVAFLPHKNRGVCVLSNGSGAPPPANLGKQLLELAQSQAGR